MGIPIGDEKDLQAAVQDRIVLAGWPKPLRINSGTVRVKGRHRDRSVRLAPKGTSDLLGIVPGPGRLLAIEVKRKGGKVREGQREFLANVRKFGGVGLLADSLDVIERALSALQLDPTARLTESGHHEGSNDG